MFTYQRMDELHEMSRNIRRRLTELRDLKDELLRPVLLGFGETPEPGAGGTNVPEKK